MTEHSHHAPNTKLYFMVFGALMVLTVVTVLVSYLHFPPALGIFIGLLIATFKAALVAAFFMHLKGERLLIYGLLGITLICAAIMLLIPLDIVKTEDTRIHEPAMKVAAPHEP